MLLDRQPWHLCLDESYNKHVLCVGGVLAPARMFDGINAKWLARIALENRHAQKKGFKPLSRYHATDCANLKREFSEKNGWDIPRQIRFSKRLCEIVRESGIWVVVIGALLEDIMPVLPDGDRAESLICNLCLRMALEDVAAIIRERYRVAKVTLVFDQGDQFELEVTRAFATLKDGSTSPAICDHFDTAEPRDSRTCIPLQIADLVSYEAMKRMDDLRKGKADLRKSLRALSNDDTTLIMDQFTRQNFEHMVVMMNNRMQGKRPWVGVDSKMVDILPPVRER